MEIPELKAYSGFRKQSKEIRLDLLAESNSRIYGENSSPCGEKWKFKHVQNARICGNVFSAGGVTQ